MTMNEDLIDRLEARCVYGDARLLSGKKHDPLSAEAAAEIYHLRAENERLRAALQPFSEEAGYWISHNYSREDRPVEGFKGYTSVMTCGDLFNARAALAQKVDQP